MQYRSWGHSGLRVSVVGLGCNNFGGRVNLEGTRLAYSQRHIDRFGHDANMQAVEALEAFATARGHTLLELAFGWLLSKPFIPSVSAGATKPEQIEANVAAAGWIPSLEACAEVERITANLPKQPPPV